MNESYRPSNEVLPENEAEPSLPTDPTEAAAWLEENWKANGGWESQHPLKLKAKDPEGYQGLSEVEKEQFDKLGRQFTWLAEMHRSEMLWHQSYTQSNHGEIIAFRFGYEIPKNPEDDLPEAYIYRPFGKEKLEVYLSKGSDGWKSEPLADVYARYAEHFAY